VRILGRSAVSENSLIRRSHSFCIQASSSLIGAGSSGAKGASSLIGSIWEATIGLSCRPLELPGGGDADSSSDKCRRPSCCAR
jgi:hypothetical protein